MHLCSASAIRGHDREEGEGRWSLRPTKSRGGLIVRKGTETIMCALLARTLAVATHNIRVINLASAAMITVAGRQQSLP